MDARSLGDMLRRTVERTPDKVAMLSPGREAFASITYAQLFDRVGRYATVLRGYGIARGDRVCIIAENCAEWAVADWACQCTGVALSPIYPTLPPDQVQYIVEDCGARFVIAGSPELGAKVRDARVIPLSGSGSLEEKSAATQVDPQWLNSEIDATRLDDLATIIYTSGTTGPPKGAMMPHRAFIHVCECAQRSIPLNERDVFLTFLPMSHVYERVAGQCLPIALGATIAYAKSLASLTGDIGRVRPTVMLCVPRFLEAMRDRTLDAVAKMRPMQRRMFHLAMAQGVRRAQGKIAPLAGVLDGLVMKKVRDRLGGRMRYFVSGGAALAPAVAEFYMGCGLTVLQGWGLTETSGGTCINHPDRNTYWTVGESLGMEIKIAADGEILVRGPALMLGYLNRPEETALAIDPDGWFHTGDIGEFEGRNLKITDRKKDLIVLGNGKNVAPQPIENRLRESPFIAEAVVLGDGMEHCVALIVPNADAVRAALRIPDGGCLAENVEVRALIKKEIERVNRTLANFEAIKKHALVETPFSIEGGELTPTLKIKRKVVANKYAKEIASLRGG
jgi:long-chain acyl-CoA synthetase